jgi:catechol 2,3-dioxygenase-like lactoylglutathione lyase family enzyme
VPIERVAIVSVPVSDVARSAAFYGALGFEVTRDDESVPGMRWVELTPPGGAPALVLATWFETMAAGSLRGLVLGSDDVVGDHRVLADRGVEICAAPEVQPWGTEMVVRDPDGNEIVVQQRPGR